VTVLEALAALEDEPEDELPDEPDDELPDEPLEAPDEPDDVLEEPLIGAVLADETADDSADRLPPPVEVL